VTNSTFSDNSATNDGGGISNDGTLTVTNSTFSGNSASSGGGASSYDNTLTVINSTFSGNSGASGGGIYNSSSSMLNYFNTIIANSTSGGDCVNSGAIGTNTTNLVEDGSCSAALSGDPHLDVLADNGGPTQTMKLLAGSPAIDAGDNATCAAAPVNNLDQRGITRPQDSHCDIGAFEAPDVISPTVLSSLIANTRPGNVNFLVTFSENVTGVDASDFSLTTTDAPGAAISSVSGSGESYTVSVDTGSGDGTIRLDVLDDDTIVDMLSRPLDGGFTSGEIYTIDNVPPTVLSSVVTDVSPYSANFIVTFSENVTGVDASDFTLQTTGAPAATIKEVNGSGASYTIIVNTGTSEGLIRLYVLDDDTIMDGTTNPLGSIGLGNGNYNAGEAYTASHSLSRVSISTEGVEGSTISIGSISISDDGRYVAFDSQASNLVNGDTNGQTDVFVRDTHNNVTTRVSLITNGMEQANGYSYGPSISADGRYVAFTSAANNLVSGDINGKADIFVRDTQTNTTTLVSLATDGSQGNANSLTPAISADGRYVVFYSLASNLVSGDTNGLADIFLRDIQTHTTIRVSLATDGTQGNAAPDYNDLSLSADGHYVIFKSNASNLVNGDTNERNDIFLRDIQTNTTTRVSLATDGTQGNSFVYGFTISADGRYVVFASASNNVVSSDTNGKDDIFVRDILTNITTRVSLATDGGQTNDSSSNPSISANGRYVVFQSYASNLVSGDTNGKADIFVRDTLTNITTRVSLAADGTQGNDSMEYPVISADGRYVAFLSKANNLVSQDTNNTWDVFLYTNTTTATFTEPGLTAGTYDDTDAAWTYSGNWATYNGTGPYADTLHYSTTVGDSAEVHFTGEQFSLTYTALADRGVVDLYVDDVKVVTLNEGGPGSWQQRWFSDPLASGNHTLRIVHASGGVVDIDAITIIDTANILSAGKYDEASGPYCSRPTGIPTLDRNHITVACTSPSAQAKALSSASAVSNSNCSIPS
jgi:hypothetical protein